VLKNIENSD